jgi:hypothetical protein
MKANCQLTAALIALGIVSQASADNVVYVTGSTAFRGTLYNVLHVAGPVFDSTNAVTEAEFGSSQSGANYMLFHGTINGTATYINCAWSGSEAGIASASNVTIQNEDKNGNLIPLAGSPQTWLKADGSIPMTGLQGSAPSSSQLEASSHAADLSQADTSQAVSLTPRVPNTSTDLKDYGVEGIVNFTFAKNVNSAPSAEWTAFSNVTIPQLNILFASGFQPTAFFSGNVSHTNNYVYLVGRNKGSGTRANELATTGYGTTRPIQQFSIGEGIETPATGTLLLDYEGNNGYESGGGVATAMGIDGSCAQTDPFATNHLGWYAVAMLGVSDAQSHGLAVSPNWVAVDGVMESDGAIEEGQYYLWGHEHLFGSHNISGYQDTVGQKIFAGVQNYLSSNSQGAVPTAHSVGIALKYMHCDKASDIAYPTRN